MEKKISFGFNKVSKKNTIFVNKLTAKEDKNKIELIKCLEGQSIQLVEEQKEEAPLIIPLKDNCKTSAALLSLKTRQAVLNGEELPAQEDVNPTEVLKDVKPNGNVVDDIEKRAARELLAEIGKGDQSDEVITTLVLPVKAEDLPLDGAKESTLFDYDSIPITQFGLAMLRGMGWKDQPKKKGAAIDEGPILRPKGMGLGADKALKPKALLVAPEANEVLEIKRGACVRVLGGKHKDLYGQVEGLDEHAGRVIVKMALGSTKESFNEFMVQPVSKKEYAQYSKCINSAKYDEYKRMENENGQIIIIKDELIQKENPENLRPDSSHHSRNIKEEYDRKYNKKNVSSRRNSSETENNPRKSERRSRSREKCYDEYSRSSTSHKKYSSGRDPYRHRSKSDNTRSSDSSTYRSKPKKKSSKSKKSKKSKGKSRERRHSSQSLTEDERRHKKKTKKSKRGRSRSRSKGRR